jgi:hypothetical protein
MAQYFLVEFCVSPVATFLVDISHHQNVLAGPSTYPASYSLCTEGFIPGGKAARALG